MNQEKQRIAIAGACGWRHKERVFEVGVQIELGGWYDPDGHFYGEHTSDLPNYLNSLDAIHEAEKALFEGGLALSVASPELRRELYFSQLIKVCGDHPAMSATAEQRAKAFLKTLGLWEEE